MKSNLQKAISKGMKLHWKTKKENFMKSILPYGFDKPAPNKLYTALWAINSAIVDAQSICADEKKMKIYKELENLTKTVDGLLEVVGSPFVELTKATEPTVQTNKG